MKDKYFNEIKKGNIVLVPPFKSPYVVVGFKLNDVVVVENIGEDLCSDVRANEITVL